MNTLEVFYDNTVDQVSGRPFVSVRYPRRSLTDDKPSPTRMQPQHRNALVRVKFNKSIITLAQMTDLPFMALFEDILSDPNLYEFNITGEMMTKTDFDGVATNNALSNLRVVILQNIDSDETIINSGGVSSLYPYFGAALDMIARTNVVYIDISECKFSLVMWDLFYNRISQSLIAHSLCYLCLDSCGIDNNIFLLLVALLLGTHNNVQHLSLACNEISDMSHLKDLLSTKQQPILYINLSENKNILPRDVAAFFGDLAHNTTLLHLDMSYVQYEDELMGAVATLLNKNTSLQSISIAAACEIPSFMDDVIKGLTANNQSRIEYLDIRAINMGVESHEDRDIHASDTVILLSKLIISKLIRVLDISGCGLSLLDMEHILDALRQNQTMLEIRYDDQVWDDNTGAEEDDAMDSDNRSASKRQSVMDDIESVLTRNRVNAGAETYAEWRKHNNK